MKTNWIITISNSDNAEIDFYKFYGSVDDLKEKLLFGLLIGLTILQLALLFVFCQEVLHYFVQLLLQQKIIKNNIFEKLLKIMNNF